MATLVPSFVFTDQVPAQQLVSLAQIENANRQGQRQQLESIARLNAAREEQRNRNAIQMAQLAQQDRQFGQEAELRKALQQADIEGRRSLQQGQFDFYTKNPNLLQNRDLPLLEAQHKTDLENWDTDADAEASRAQAQLNLIEQGINRTRTLLGIDPLWKDMGDEEFKREYATRAQPILSGLLKSRPEVDPITGRIRVVPIYKGRKAQVAATNPVSQSLIGQPGTGTPPVTQPQNSGGFMNYIRRSLGPSFYGGGPTSQSAITGSNAPIGAVNAPIQPSALRPDIQALMDESIRDNWDRDTFNYRYNLLTQ